MSACGRNDHSAEGRAAAVRRVVQPPWPRRCLCRLHCWRSRPGSSREADEILQVLHDGDQQESIGGSGHPAQSQASEAQMTIEMCDAHLDLPAFTGRLFEGLTQHKGTTFIGNLFSPVMFAWFVVIGLLGVVRSPAVLGAINPQ